MKKSDLKVILEEMYVPEDMYHLDDYGINDQKLCLNKMDNLWLVYYCERGSKLVTSEFEKEEDACEEFIKRIKKMMDNLRRRQSTI